MSILSVDILRFDAVSEIDHYSVSNQVGVLVALCENRLRALCGCLFRDDFPVGGR
jgi:hypothetical protein